MHQDPDIPRLRYAIYAPYHQYIPASVACLRVVIWVRAAVRSIHDALRLTLSGVTELLRAGPQQVVGCEAKGARGHECLCIGLHLL